MPSVTSTQLSPAANIELYRDQLQGVRAALAALQGQVDRLIDALDRDFAATTGAFEHASRAAQAAVDPCGGAGLEARSDHPSATDIPEQSLAHDQVEPLAAAPADIARDGSVPEAAAAAPAGIGTVAETIAPDAAIAGKAVAETACEPPMLVPETAPAIQQSPCAADGGALVPLQGGRQSGEIVQLAGVRSARRASRARRSLAIAASLLVLVGGAVALNSELGDSFGSALLLGLADCGEALINGNATCAAMAWSSL